MGWALITAKRVTVPFSRILIQDINVLDMLKEALCIKNTCSDLFWANATFECSKQMSHINNQVDFQSERDSLQSFNFTTNLAKKMTTKWVLIDRCLQTKSKWVKRGQKTPPLLSRATLKSDSVQLFHCVCFGWFVDDTNAKQKQDDGKTTQ